MSSTDRATLLALDSQQKDELINKLVDFYPSTREAILTVLSTIAPTQPAPKVKLTESQCFVHEVETCEYWLSNQDWMINATSSCRASCEVISKAVIPVLNRIKHLHKEYLKHEHWDNEPLPAGCDNVEDFSLDANIACVDIGVLILKRRNRLLSRGWRCSSESCPWTANLVKTFDNVRCWIATDPVTREENEFRYLFHEQPDGSTDPLRLTFLKFLDLPSLLPPMDPNYYDDEDRTDDREDRMNEVWHAIRLLVRGVQLPNLTSNLIADVGDIAV